MNVTLVRTVEELDAQCYCDGNCRVIDGVVQHSYRDYAPGETPICEWCDNEITVLPLIIWAGCSRHERVFLHAATCRDALIHALEATR